MHVRDIVADGTLLARHVPAGSWPPGLAFHSADGEFVQVGTWRYDAGRELQAHRHTHLPRTAGRTQEVVFVRAGAVTASIFDEAGNPVEEVRLGAGDLLVLLAGGHGYRIEADGTEVLEVKNGPYAGAAADRVRFTVDAPAAGA